LKTPILAILLTLPLTLPLCGNEEKPSPNPPVNEYGIEPEAWYRGEEVTEILRGTEEEAAAATAEAYDEGYKAGRIDGAALWRPLYDGAVTRAEKAEKRPTVKDLVLALLGGLAAGALTGVLAGR